MLSEPLTNSVHFLRVGLEFQLPTVPLVRIHPERCPNLHRSATAHCTNYPAPCQRGSGRNSLDGHSPRSVVRKRSLPPTYEIADHTLVH